MVHETVHFTVNRKPDDALDPLVNRDMWNGHIRIIHDSNNPFPPSAWDANLFSISFLSCDNIGSRRAGFLLRGKNMD